MKALVVLLLLAGSARADDVELWTELGVSRDVSRRVTVTFDQHLRFDDDVGRIGAVMPELGLRLRIRDWLRTGAAYRYEYERDGDAMMVSRHRGDLYVRGRIKLGAVRVELEERLELQVRPDKRDEHRQLLRDKLELSLRTRPWVPAASATLFHRLDDGTLDKLWLTVGGAYVRGGRDVELFYRFERSLRSDDAVIHIIGAAFHTGL